MSGALSALLTAQGFIMLIIGVVLYEMYYRKMRG